MPTPRYSRATVANGRIYAVGGQTTQRAVPTVEVADPGSRRWQSAPPLAEGLTRLGLATLGQDLYVMEGSSHVRLRKGASTWETVPLGPTPRHGLSVVALRGSLYAVGGCSEDWIDLAANEVYRPVGEAGLCSWSFADATGGSGGHTLTPVQVGARTSRRASACRFASAKPERADGVRFALTFSLNVVAKV